MASERLKKARRLLALAGLAGMGGSIPRVGINIAGAEFGEDELPGTVGEDYMYPPLSWFEVYRGYGFRRARLPFRWERLQRNSGGVLLPTLHAADVALLRASMDAAAQCGMKVILDCHNYGRYSLGGVETIIGDDPELQPEHLRDFWIMMADEFGGHSALLGYDIMNEPHDMLVGTPWHEIAQVVIDGIREVDNRAWIYLEGTAYSGSWSWVSSGNAVNMLTVTDPANRLKFSAHAYFDRDFSGTHFDYDTEAAEVGPEFGPEWAVENQQPFLDWLETNNLRGHIGECAVPGDDDRWLELFAAVLAEYQARNVEVDAWGGGGWWPEEYAFRLDPIDDEQRPQIPILLGQGFTPAASGSAFTADSDLITVDSTLITADAE